MIEVGFMREPPKDATLRCKVLMREPFGVALPPHHRLLSHTEIDMGDLSEEPFIHFPREAAASLYEQVMRLCREAGFTPNVTLEASQWQSIVGLVEAGLGVAVVPASFKKIKWGDVEYRPLRDRATQTTVALCYRSETLSPTVGHFVRLAKEMVRPST